MPYLRIRTGAERGKLFEVKDKPVTIGRDRSQTIQILDQGVSRQHATIFKIGELYIIRDEGATNGSYVNNVKVHEEVLKNGDEILIGSTVLAFEEKVSTARLDRLEAQLTEGEKEPLGTTTIEIVIDKGRDAKQSPGRELESKNLSAYFDMGKLILNEKDPDALIHRTTDFLFKTIKADHGYFLTVDEQSHKFHAAVAIPDSKDIKVSKTMMQHVISSKRPLLTTDAAMDQRFTYSESVILRRIKSVICAPVLSGPSLLGLWYFHSTGERGTFTAEDLELVSGCVIQVGTAFVTLKRVDEARSTTLNAARSLITSIEMFDPKVQGHSVRVAAYAQAMAREMGLCPEDIYKIRLAALLHDVGKLPVFLSQRNITSEDNLSDDRHVYFGEKLVSTVPGLEEIVPGVKYHHEKANGTGYPYHLSNTDTPVMARIIIVANAYDNLFTNNSGNQSPSELLKEFAQKEREFDPESLKAILVCHRNGVLSQIAQTTTV